jgi:hypothetical protein
LIRFQTFSFKYLLVLCGGELTELNSTITSPNYPNNYTGDLNCFWKIIAPPKYRILLKLKDFSTEKCCDCLEVFDGISVRNTSLGKYCGTTDTSPYIISTFNNILLKFTSDHSHNYKGFSADYISIPEDQSLLKLIFNLI